MKAGAQLRFVRRCRFCGSASGQTGHIRKLHWSGKHYESDSCIHHAIVDGEYWSRPHSASLPALFIPLKTEFFLAFERGEKTVEFRPYGPRWNARTCAVGRPVVLSLGYSGRRLRGVAAGFSVDAEGWRGAAWQRCYGPEPRDVACISIALTP